jgi:hypothetical protein
MAVLDKGGVRFFSLRMCLKQCGLACVYLTG